MQDFQIDLTSDVLSLCSAIERLVGRHEGFAGNRPQPLLRKQGRIKTIQGSIAIEGNSLSLDQVSALLEGKRVFGPKKDILEAHNANAAYELAEGLDAFKVADLLKAHEVMMAGLDPQAGHWRKGNVGILKGGKVSHVAPKASFVQGMIKELLAKTKRSKLHPLVSSSLFHHEFELIHPFSDGNGRMGRLWQHKLLAHFHPVFSFIPVESLIRARQKEYYRALEIADKNPKSPMFVEFMLRAIADSTQEFLAEIKPQAIKGDDRIETAREHFKKTWFSRKDYLELFPHLSTATASRDLKQAVEAKAIESQGNHALTRYRFRSI